MTSTPVRTAEDYCNALTAGLPQGPAFPREGTPVRDGLLSAIAKEMLGEDRCAVQLLTESNPETTNHLLPEWEREFGLPDCIGHAPATYQDRIAALVEKVRRTGGWNPQKIKAICARIGYEVEVVEHRPFNAGLSRCGDSLSGPASCRHWLRIRVLGQRATRFRAGRSRAGERLLVLTRAEDLECLLSLIKPAHQKVTIAYEGA